MVSCQDFTEALLDFVAKELPPHRQEELEKHVAACQACSGALAGYQRVVALARELPRPALPEGFLERFRKAAEKKESRPEDQSPGSGGA
jgi:anti-sigma factor RsiW